MPPDCLRSPEQGLRILLLEGDAGVRRSLQMMLATHGFEVASYSEAGPLLADTTIASAGYLIAEYRLADRDGIKVLLALREMGWLGRAVLIVGSGSHALRQAAIGAGYHAVLEKPVAPHELLAAIS